MKPLLQALLLKAFSVLLILTERVWEMLAASAASLKIKCWGDQRFCPAAVLDRVSKCLPPVLAVRYLQALPCLLVIAEAVLAAGLIGRQWWQDEFLTERVGENSPDMDKTTFENPSGHN